MHSYWNLLVTNLVAALRVDPHRHRAGGAQQRERGEQRGRRGQQQAGRNGIAVRGLEAALQAHERAHRDTEREHAEAGEEQRAGQYRHVVAQHRHAGTGERRDDDECRAGGGQREGALAPRASRSIAQRPEKTGEGKEPDQHREVHVGDQCDAEQVDARQPLVGTGGAGQHQQYREQAGTGQCDEPEQQPAACRRKVLGRQVDGPGSAARMRGRVRLGRIFFHGRHCT